ncbi:MAG: hypothetical protein M1838_002236 [Thelocarpon superellum]|nr:MAG: hypothetical protein M1838_002236 [Thelocarpon superellum]
MWDSDEDDLNQQEIENATSKVFANLGVDPKSLQANRAANEGLAKLLGYNVVANGVWPKSPKRMMRLFRRLLARRDLAAVAKSVQASDQRSS